MNSEHVETSTSADTLESPAGGTAGDPAPMIGGAADEGNSPFKASKARAFANASWRACPAAAAPVAEEGG